VPYNLALGTQWPTAIRRAFGIREGAVQVVSPEIQPSYDPMARPEMWALAGGDLTMGGTQLSALAANFSVIIFANPTGSGVIFTIEALTLGIGTSDTISVAWGLNPALGTLVQRMPRVDTRRMGTLAALTLFTPIEVRTLQQVGTSLTGLGVWQVRQLANDGKEWSCAIVLGPGGICLVQSGSVNEFLAASCRGRVRQATADEISVTNAL